MTTDNSATDIVLADIAVAKRVLDRDIAGPCHCDRSVDYICECCFVRQTLNVAANELKRIAALEADNANLREQVTRLQDAADVAKSLAAEAARAAEGGEDR